MLISATEYEGTGLSLQKGLGDAFELLTCLYYTIISTDILLWAQAILYISGWKCVTTV